MTTFQLDQCLDSKRFARDCSAEGVCQVQRLPPGLRGKEDPELLTAVMVAAHPLVTFDRVLARDHTPFIPESKPGIIGISNYPAPQTMTVAIAQKVLRKFKSAFPDWHRASWRNSIVEITLAGIEVGHVAGGKLMRDAYFTFDAPEWQRPLADLLDENS